jgi:hypothetical protein
MTKKIVTNKPTWIGKTLTFGGGVGDVKFSKQGVADVEEEHLPYLVEEHGLLLYSDKTQGFVVETASPEQRLSVFEKMETSELQQETAKLAGILSKEEGEWKFKKHNALATYLMELWNEVDSMDLAEKSTEEKPKRGRKKQSEEELQSDVV